MKARIANRNLPQLFLQARDTLMAHFKPIINHFGVTEQQWRILRALDEHGQLEQWELCDMCQILSSSMAGVLARMEETGLIRRSRLAEDQRRVIVQLAAAGDRLMTEMAPLIDQQYRHLEQMLGGPLLHDLFKTLESFVATREVTVPAVKLPARKSGKPAAKKRSKA